MTNSVEFCCTHDIGQGVVVRIHSEMGSVVQIVPELFTHSPFQCEELQFSTVQVSTFKSLVLLIVMILAHV